MKYIITISILLFSFCSFGQFVDSSAKLKTFDQNKWVRNPSSEIVSTDGFRRWKIGSQFMCICPTGQIYIDSTVQVKAECKHIFIAVEPDTVTLTRGAVSLLTYPEHGKDIVCVKCLYQTKQQIKYREPILISTWQILDNGFFKQR